MPSESAAHRSSNYSGLSGRYRSSADFYLLAALIAWEACALLAKALAKPLWYDEIVTFHLSGLQPFARLWSALKAGADGTPPAYYMILQVARRLHGDPHQLVRLPSIVGYLLALVAIYCFVRRRRSGVVALIAVLLLSLSPFREYAVEARPYGLVVGLLAMAAVAWQAVESRRYLSIALFGCLALAVSCHYFAVVSLAIFGFAEITFTLETRRLRWEVWTAIVLASIPFFLLLPNLLHFGREFTPHFWSRVKWSDLVLTYSSYMPLDLKLVLALLVLFTLVIVREICRRVRKAGAVVETDSTLSEMVLMGGFMLYPVMLVLITKVLHSVYHWRYGWPAVFGLVLGIIYFLRLPRITYKATVCALLEAFCFRGINDFARFYATRSSEIDDRWSRLGFISQRQPDLPVVMGSGLRFLEAVEYSPPELRLRLVELLDEAAAIRLVGTDTVERNNRVIAKFVPLAVVERSSFEMAHQQFILYSTDGGLDWVTPYVLNRGYRLTLIGKVGADSIYLATREGTSAQAYHVVPGAAGNAAIATMPR